MRIITIFLFLFLFFCNSFCQSVDAWVVFKDKRDVKFYLNNPEKIISKKSYDRKKKYNIPIDITDVPINSSYLKKIARLGVNIVAKSKWFNRVHVKADTNVINKIKKFKFIKKVILADRTRRLSKNTNIIKTVKTNRINLDPKHQINMLNGDKLHDMNFKGQGITIAVMDGGFKGVDSINLFSKLRDERRVLYTYDLVNRKEYVYDGDYHGTSVLSALAGHEKDKFVGSAEQSYYYLFKTEDVKSETPVEESYWVEAIEIADSLGVDIINSSLGYFYYDNSNHSYDFNDLDGSTAFISMAADMASKKGILVVNSGGNSGYRKNGWIGTPADAEGILAVGAVDIDGNYVNFSSFGPTSDGRIKPDVAALGLNVIAIDGNRLGFVNGTSLASPLIAGLSACLWQAMRGENNFYVMNLIKNNSNYAKIPNNLYGYGIPDFFAALELHYKRNSNKEFSIVGDKIFIDEYMYVDSAKLIIKDNLGREVLNQIIRENDKYIDISNISIGSYTMEIKFKSRSIKSIIIKKF